MANVKMRAKRCTFYQCPTISHRPSPREAFARPPTDHIQSDDKAAGLTDIMAQICCRLFAIA